MSAPLRFEFAPIRYVHDPVLDESLNVGVALFIPRRGEFLIEIDDSFHRLSQAFPGFDGLTYRRAAHELLAVAHTVAKESQRELKADRDLFREGGIKSFMSAAARALPDAESSLRLGRVSVGVTEDPEHELASLFHRLVKANQVPQKDQKRSDEQIWHDFQRELTPKVKAKLEPRTIRTKVVDVEFEATFENGDVHAIQPLSFDYVKADTISAKAARWVGLGVALEAARAVQRLYLLLGRPGRRENRRAFDRAKDLLHQMPLKHELVEESNAKAFSTELASFMKEHGVIDDD